ncbi:hypothetical protein B0H16DRAFT_1456688 [Mycena metata]|uniref:Uncharacterized protein n=1 Tax=Mycena metata TaxID=1033252 RepID=A0AAD7NGG8_9AGAR|nr:hypothetical protein B0H16DRAFT_1456688 [Mycena metata]
MLQAESAAKIFQEKVRTIILQAEIGVDYSEEVSKKGAYMYTTGRTRRRLFYKFQEKEGDNARADALQRTNEQEAPVFSVALVASGAVLNAATRAAEEVELHKPLLVEPEMSLAIGIAFRVAFAPRGNVLGHAELHPERAPELGRGDGVGREGVVGGGGNSGAAVQMARDTVAGVEAAVSQMQLALVPRIRAAGDGAEGAGAVAVDEMDVNLLLGGSAKAARGGGGGRGGGGASAAAQGGGAGHGVGERARNAEIRLKEARE